MPTPGSEFARLGPLVRSFVERRGHGEVLSAATYLAGMPFADARLKGVLKAAEAWSPETVDAELRARLAADRDLAAEPAPEQEPEPTAVSGGHEGAGQVIDGRYRVERELGKGGFGAVYLVQDLLHDAEQRALKVILPAHSSDPQFERRFRNEIRVLRSLSHAGIPQIHNDGRTADGAFYYTMAFVEGVTLAEVLKRSGPLPPERIVRLVRQMIEVLDYAHQRGVVHRDLKPANVMLVDAGDEHESVRVLDFGIAKILSREGELEHALTMNTIGAMGTPHYMSPEQVRGKQVDQRTDIYALGIIIYQMCSGLLPFSGTSLQEIATARLDQPPAPLPPDKAPAWLRELIMSLLARDKEARPQAQQILERLERLQTSHHGLRRSLLALSAAVVLVAAGTVYALVRPRETRGEELGRQPVATRSSGAATPAGTPASSTVAAPGPTDPPPPGAPEAGDDPLADDPATTAAAPGALPPRPLGPPPRLELGGLEGLVADGAGATWYVRRLPARLEGQVAGPVGEGRPASVRVDGREVGVDEDGRFALDGLRPELDADGRRRLVLEVADAWGRSDAREVLVVLDDSAPVLELRTPVGMQPAAAGGWLTGDERATVELAVREAHPAGGEAWRVEADGERTPVELRSAGSADLLQLADVPLRPGENLFELLARDLAGNESRAVSLRVKRAGAIVGELECEGWPGPLAPGTRELTLRGQASGPLGSVALESPDGAALLEARLDARDPTRFELRVGLPFAGERFALSVRAEDAEGDPLARHGIELVRSAPLVAAGCTLGEGARSCPRAGPIGSCTRLRGSSWCCSRRPTRRRSTSVARR